MFDFSWLAEELQAREQAGMRRQKRTVTPQPGGWCLVEGRRCRNFAGNDYLGLAWHPDVIAAAQDCLSQSGCGITASPLVTGRTPWHEHLEAALASYFQQPAAILFPTGYTANLGTIAALARSGDVVYCERHNHACLVDGCRLSGASLRVFRVTELQRLATWLAQRTSQGRCWIVVDSLFSMEGTLAPLVELCDLAEQYEAGLIIDEAHAYGVLGEHGRGAAEMLGVEHRIPVRIGTLSKAFAALGGFVTGDSTLIDGLWNLGRTQMYSTALPPVMCAAATAALDIAQSEPWRRLKVISLAEQLRSSLRSHGWQVPDGTGPIVPVILGDSEQTMSVAARLQEQGIVVGAIRPPTVPAGTSRLRITITADCTEQDLAELMAAIQDATGGLEPFSGKS